MDLNYYTVDEVAEMVGHGKDWVWTQCRERKIPHHRIGRAYRFSADDLKALAAQTAVTPIQAGNPASSELLPSKARRRRATQ